MKTKQTKLNTILIGILGAIFLLNLVVMIFFTTTINIKLSEAINLTAPQKGELILITAENCKECRSLDEMKNYVADQNIEVSNDKTISSNDEEGKKLIKKYEIEKLPALIFDSEKKIKTQLKKNIAEGGKQTEETTLIWEQSFPPYFDLKTNKTVGLVKITLITDNGCTECYDVQEIKQAIINNFGITVTEEKMTDITDEYGKELLQKYKIKNVPTIILSEEAKNYENLKLSWKEVGTIEEDGNFIFRELDIIEGKFKNLETGEIK